MFNQINENLKKAMKSGDKFKLSVIRMLKSDLQLESISKKHDLSDAEVISVIRKQVKMRKDSIDEYQKYNKLNMVDTLNQEVEILSNYLPPEMSEEELNQKISKMFDELKPEGMQDIGKCMKYASENIKN